MSSLICNVPLDVCVPPKFVVNLDLPPTLRWQHILRIYRDKLRETEKKLHSMINEMVGEWAGVMLEKIISTFMAGITQLGLVHYGEELKSFSQETDISLGKLVMMQFVYESVACCTSIVCQDEKTNIPMHIRTMDWEFDFLKPLTIGNYLYRETIVEFYLFVLLTLLFMHISCV